MLQNYTTKHVYPRTTDQATASNALTAGSVTPLGTALGTSVYADEGTVFINGAVTFPAGTSGFCAAVHIDRIGGADMNTVCSYAASISLPPVASATAVLMAFSVDRPAADDFTGIVLANGNVNWYPIEFNRDSNCLSAVGDINVYNAPTTGDTRRWFGIAAIVQTASALTGTATLGALSVRQVLREVQTFQPAK